MLSFTDKISILENYLLEVNDNYADSFKTDILFYFNEFEDVQTDDFKFLKKLNYKEEIYLLVDDLTSKIVLKFNEDEEQLSDFIFYELNK